MEDTVQKPKTELEPETALCRKAEAALLLALARRTLMAGGSAGRGSYWGVERVIVVDTEAGQVSMMLLPEEDIPNLEHLPVYNKGVQASSTEDRIRIYNLLEKRYPFDSEALSDDVLVRSSLFLIPEEGNWTVESAGISVDAVNLLARKGLVMNPRPRTEGDGGIWILTGRGIEQKRTQR